jgi:hypothetical protein
MEKTAIVEVKSTMKKQDIKITHKKLQQYKDQILGITSQNQTYKQTLPTKIHSNGKEEEEQRTIITIDQIHCIKMIQLKALLQIIS